MITLKDKNALITGGSRGIGLAIAEQFAELGANVAIAYMGSEEEGQQAKQTLSKYDVKCEVYICDVSSFDGSKKVVDDVLKQFGGIDILVNNAGITKDGLVRSMKEEDFDSVINVNLKGAFNMIKHVYPHFLRKRYGRIINTASVVGINGNAGQANYVSSKAGLIGLTKSIAKELGSRNVTCNAIAPGFITTAMTDVLNEKQKADMLDIIPMKRAGLPEDIAQTVAFLASDCASYITGEVIRIDGGMAM